MHIISGYVAIINGLNGTEHIKTNNYNVNGQLTCSKGQRILSRSGLAV